MQEARVLGTAVSTIKHHSMVGSKMLIVQPYLSDGTTPDGFPLLAIDSVGAGKDGSSSRPMGAMREMPMPKPVRPAGLRWY